MGGLLLLLVALAVIYFVYRRNTSWRTMMSRSGEQVREVQARYAFLESNQVKCRVRTESDASLGAVQPAASAVDWNRTESMKLQVHKKDLGRAEALLAQFDQQQPAVPLG